MRKITLLKLKYELSGGGDEEEDGTQSNPIDLADEKEEDEEDNLVKN